MKTIFNICIALVLSILISCNQKTEPVIPQTTIPNSDFENWSIINDFDKPDSWNTSNFSLYNIVTFNTVSKDSLTTNLGKYFPKLVTKSQLIDNNFVKVAGLITLGNFDINIATREAQVSGGIPFVNTPTTLSGSYKYNGVGIDSCFIDVSLTKFNSHNKNQDIVANGRFSSGSTSDWTSFSIPIKYFMEDSPDSLNIIILSSDTSIFETGSTLWIDNLSFKY